MERKEFCKYVNEALDKYGRRLRELIGLTEQRRRYRHEPPIKWEAPHYLIGEYANCPYCKSADTNILLYKDRRHCNNCERYFDDGRLSPQD